ncbi:MAG: rhodanese-like domain-containing protein [Bryobacterales bacterium]|nr:rhodanese-like domain-containing protein [Bryobacterales bacterium]
MRVLSLAGWLLVASAWPARPAEAWKESDLLQPAQLAARLKEAGAKPLLIEISFPVLYRARHIPGAVFAGPTARPQGLELLRKAVANQPKDSEIVLYCGCCPFDKCPNVRPAFEAMRALGFGRVKVLFIPVNLVKDWVEKGYPITRPGGK